MAQVKRKAKVRVKGYGTLKKRLDAVFSLFVRRRLAVGDMATCVTCSKVSHWKTMQCGHFIPRHYLAGRWNLENCAVQCPSCNIWGRGRYPEFAQWGVNRYGQGWLPKMIALKRETLKLTRSDLETMIEDYETRLRQIEQ